MNRLAIYLVVCIGFIQIIGFAIQSKEIRGIGALTVSSPLPIVFTTVKGLETFSSRFYFEVSDNNQIIDKIEITPELYSKINGPYNRRNVFGAAIAYGPILDSNLLTAVLDYAIYKNNLIKELNLDTTKNYKIIVVPKSSKESIILKSNSDV